MEIYQPTVNNLQKNSTGQLRSPALVAYIEKANNRISIPAPNNIDTVDIKQNGEQINTKENKTKIAISAFIGAILPVIALNALKKGRVNDIINSFKDKLSSSDKFKAIWKMLEIESLTEILATTAGGIAGGLLSGLKQANTKEEKEAKYKEGIFEFLNNITPTIIVGLGLKGLQKLGKAKNIPLQAAMILSGVISGMFIANKTSNKINAKIFDKDKEEKTVRNFKPLDCLVHIDDLVNILVLAKVPFASTLQVDKILPIIYARAGYEVGAAKKEDKEA